MAFGFSAGQLVGAAALAVLLFRLGVGSRSPRGRLGIELGRRLAAAAGAALVGWVVAGQFDSQGWVPAVVGSASVAAVVLAGFLCLWWATGGPTPALALRTLGATERGRP
jgi:hypothetical protein